MRRLMILILLAVIGPSWASAASVDLAWTASTDTTVTGYRLYRGAGVCPGLLSPLLINGVQAMLPKTASTFTDPTVPAITGTLCYEITAVNSTGMESPRSVRIALTLTPPLPPPPVSTIETRVTALESKLTALTTRVTAAEAKLAGICRAAKAMGGSATSLQGRLRKEMPCL